MSDYTPPTNAHIRMMIARRWRERDRRGLWFWASWLLIRWHVFPIATLIAASAASSFVVGFILR